MLPKHPGPSCSKLTTSLVNDSLKCTLSDTQIPVCWIFLLKNVSAKATRSFSAKNIRILCIESAKTVNEMALNELVKLTFEQLAKWSWLWITRSQVRIQCHNCMELFGIFFFITKKFGRWSSVVKVSCVLRHGGVQLILAYIWARPPILVAGKGRGRMFLFFLFLHFLSCSYFFPFLSFISSTISFLPFSGRWHKMTYKVDVSLNPKTIKLWKNSVLQNKDVMGGVVGGGGGVRGRWGCWELSEVYLLVNLFSKWFVTFILKWKNPSIMPQGIFLVLSCFHGLDMTCVERELTLHAG